MGCSTSKVNPLALKITVDKEYVVKPTASPTLHTRPLLLIDAGASRVAVNWVWFFPTGLDVDSLIKGLATLQDRYPEIGGTIKLPDKQQVEEEPTAVLSIETTGQGVRFRECIATGVETSELPTPEHPEQIPIWAQGAGNNQFLWPVDLKNIPGSASPMSVSLTHLPGGGVALGVSISHVLADAMCTTTLIHEWSLIVRDPSLVSSVPKSMDRVALWKATQGTSDPPPPQGLEPMRSMGGFETVKLVSKLLWSGQGYDQRTIHLSPPVLTQLKGIVSATLSTPDEWVSTHDCVMAHVIRSVLPFLPIHPDPLVTMLTVNVLDGRRLRGDLPEQGFIGNGSVIVCPVLSTDALYESGVAGLTRVALQIRRHLQARVSPDTVAGYFLLNQQAGRAWPSGAPVPSPWFDAPLPEWTAWSPYHAFPLLDCDFGSGKPVFVGMDVPPMGMGVLYRTTPACDGGVNVHVHQKQSWFASCWDEVLEKVAELPQQ